MPEIYLADHYGNDTDQNTAVSASRMKKILISCGACEGKDRGTIAAVHRLYREGEAGERFRTFWVCQPPCMEFPRGLLIEKSDLLVS